MNEVVIPDVVFAIALIAATILAAAFFRSRANEAERTCDVYAKVREDVNLSMALVDKVLSDQSTPPNIRRMLLLVLKFVSEPALGKAFLMGVLSEKVESGTASSFAIALREMDPKRAEEVQKALTGSFMALGLIHADKVEFSAVAAQSAMRPSSIVAELNRRLGLNNDDHFDDGPMGPFRATATA